MAKRFVSVDSFYELQKLIESEKDLFLLSGGSNMLLTSDIDKLVTHINIKGVSIDKEDENCVYLTVNSGEDWHEFVLWCIDQNYGGIENLSLIPGNVGTSPIQNIGAYGVEVKDVITKVEALEIATAKRVQFSNEECEFGYRNSIFKNKAKGKYIITSVSFRLTKKNHIIHKKYGAIESELQTRGIKNPTIKDISDAVIAIRKSKLPDPKEIGNSGSFFKNPVIAVDHFQRLQKLYPEIPFYEVRPFDSNSTSLSADEAGPVYHAQGDILYKVPAGWLIEKAGFKGKRYGDHGVHGKQALVLVNYGNAKGQDIFDLATIIQKEIKSLFDIELEIEVNII